VDPIQQNEYQSACTYDGPKSEPLEKWSKAYAFHCFPIESGADQKQRYCQAALAELVEGTEGVIPGGQHSVQQSGQAEDQNEPWPLDASLGFQREGGDKR
jgi:hypothetical protein